MRTAAICPTCATYINALCVIYNGPNLTNINVATLDTIQHVIQNINSNLVPVHGGGAPTNGATYIGQLYVNSSTGDIYYAETTGTGPADWVQIARNSTLQDLQSVLIEGDTSDQNIVLVDNLVTPITTGTFQSTQALFHDSSQDLFTAYGVNSIYIQDSTSAFLEIDLDNLQDQIISFPDTSGQLALLSDTILDLQNVTDNGNITTNGINADSCTATPSYTSTFAASLGYDGNGTTAAGILTLREDSTGSGFTSTIGAYINLTSDRTINVPDENGTIVLSVNGIGADDQGDVTLPLLPYTSYVARITQAGAAPIAVGTVMENTIVSPITFTYVNPGEYTIDCIDFDTPTTVVFIQKGGGPFVAIISALASTGSITITTSDAAGTLANDLMNSACIEIRVYS